MSEDLDQKYRPTSLDAVIGQPDAVRALKAFKDKIPRALLLHGPTGVGKTTIARILCRSMKISRMDLQEKNCASLESAIDFVREVGAQMTAYPLEGEKRAWILDEVQSFSKSNFAQQALLKVLEECPPHVHFMLCTTDPKKLLAAVRGRCVEVGLRALKPAETTELVNSVAKAEGVKVPDATVEAIVDAAEGSARNALKALEKVIGIADPAQQLAAVPRTAAAGAAFDLVKALMPWKGEPAWAEVAKVLTDIKEEDPEGLRQMVLACARTNLLKARQGGSLCYKVIRCLDQPLFDRNSGHALLAAGCYQVCFGGK